MTIQFALMKRGSIAGGVIETIYRTTISASETDDLDVMERFFRKVLEDELGFVAETARSGEQSAYTLWVMYDIKEDVYLLALQERKKCLHRLKTVFDVEM